MSSAIPLAAARGDGSELGPADLLAMIDSGRPLLVVDVRNDEEHASWSIEGIRPFRSVHVPYFEFIEDPDEAIRRIPFDPAPIAVVCAKGGSSEMVAGMLRDAGRDARNVAGGMFAYGGHLHSTPVPLADADVGRLEIWQVNRRGKGCLSYVLRSGGEAMVVDPSRRTEFYQSLVTGLRARITVVLDTHVHADHLSGGLALANAAGAKYLMPSDAGASSLGVRDGMILRVGEAVAQIIATPGHTPESVCLLMSGRYLATGDTLFARGIGRPDLGSDLGAWARLLYRTLQTALSRLPDRTLVLPAHYSKASEIGPDGIVSGLLGDLRRSAPELQLKGEAEFVAAMERAAAPVPQSYSKIARANRLLDPVPEEQASEWEIGRNECAARAIS